MTRRVAGLAAAGTLSLYLAVKVIWVAVALLGDGPPQSDGSTAEWVILNAVTVVMATTGIALGMALAQPWGMRLPTAPVLFFSWMGSGFLGSLLPYGVVAAVLSAAGVRLGNEDDAGADGGSAGGAPAGDGGMPEWETAFITIGFTGMAVGLAIALPIYVRERWPHAFVGRAGAGAPEVPRGRRMLLVPAATTVLAVMWLFWVFGGKLGLNTAFHSWDLNGRLLIASGALWALLGGWSVWVLAGLTGRRLPLWLPMMTGFVASGSLFAWNSWRFVWAVLRPGDYEPLEHPAVAVVEHGIGMGAGIAILSLLIRVYRARAATHAAIGANRVIAS
ncbi:hypothetical protein AB0O76_17460 [Streptomyces sp. NPDC086554]|uniref:hypothetical protein n=1 Tax=Streptomyces sp. NPDC086554 TaxID=3154864 RepID=UPI003413B3E8